MTDAAETLPADLAAAHAMILAERAARLAAQSERRALDIEIDVFTLADWVGAVSVALRPLVTAIADHARAGPRVHVDDTPVPVLAKGKTRTGRLWTMVRGDRPFGGGAPPAPAYAYSPDRGAEHAETLRGGFTGIMQADAFAGFNLLSGKGTIVEAACWAHGRRKFYELAQLKKAPVAIEAVARIDVLLAIERDIAGLSPEERQAARAERSRPLIDDLATWLHHKRAGLADVLDRLPGHSARRIAELLPWYRQSREATTA